MNVKEWIKANKYPVSLMGIGVLVLWMVLAIKTPLGAGWSILVILT
ncbi:MAG: hypothetical protein ACD_16C00087G0001, partial [uncultured bacterium]